MALGESTKLLDETLHIIINLVLYNILCMPGTCPRVKIISTRVNVVTHVTPGLRDAQEFEVLLLEERNSVADVLGKDRLEVGAEGRVRVAGREVRLSHVCDGSGWVVEDSCPLLDLLPEVLRVESGVAGRMARTGQARSKETLRGRT